MSGAATAIHYLIEQQSVAHERRTLVDCITLRGRDLQADSAAHCDGKVFAPLGLLNDERALLLSIEKLYCVNHMGRAVKFDIDLCFDPVVAALAATTATTASLHPDIVGSVTTYAYPTSTELCNTGVVPAAHRCVYRANLASVRHNVIQYAGKEESILNARSSVVLTPTVAPTPAAHQFEVFHQTDPFLVFLLQNRPRFKTIADADVRPLAGAPQHYRVAKHAVALVKQFFADAVFPLFHYTSAKALRFKCGVVNDTEGDIDDNATLTIMFQLEYVVIVQKEARFEDTTTRLNL